MKTSLFSLMLFFATCTILAQSTEKNQRPSYLEINLMPHTGITFKSARTNFRTLSPVTPPDTLTTFDKSGPSREIQIKYLRQLKNKWHFTAGLYAGAHNYKTQFGILDSVTLLSESMTPFRRDSYYNLPQQFIYYMTGSVGLRYSINSMKNDKFNLSFSTNATFYPKQNINEKNSVFLPKRETNLEIVSTSPISDESNVTIDYDIDLNYQFGFKKNKFLLTLGRLWRFSFQDVSTYQTVASIPTETRTFTWTIRKNILMGVYVGLAYQL